MELRQHVCLPWMSVLSDSLCSSAAQPRPTSTLGGTTEEQRPWGWADHGLVQQREDWKKGGSALPNGPKGRLGFALEWGG